MCCWPKSGDGTVVKLNGRVLEDVQWACQNVKKVRIYQHRYDPTSQQYVRFEDAGDETGWATTEMEGEIEIVRPETKPELGSVRQLPEIDGHAGSRSDPYTPKSLLRAIMVASVLEGYSRRYALFIDNFGQIPGEWTLISVARDATSHQIDVGFADIKNDPFADDPEIYIRLICPVPRDMGGPILDSSFLIHCVQANCDLYSTEELLQYCKRNS
jgi:hypothetical protein